jgi:hypothetical protein
VFKHAVTKMPAAIMEGMVTNNLKLTDIDEGASPKGVERRAIQPDRILRPGGSARCVQPRRLLGSREPEDQHGAGGRISSSHGVPWDACHRRRHGVTTIRSRIAT